MQNNRGKLEIVSDILNTCKNGAAKTQIMYSCNLSYAQLTIYLEELKLRRMIVCEKDIYEVSEFGRDFRKNLDVVIALWQITAHAMIRA